MSLLDIETKLKNRPLPSPEASLGQRRRWAVYIEPESLPSPLNHSQSSGAMAKEWQSWGRGFKNLMAETFTKQPTSSPPPTATASTTEREPEPQTQTQTQKIPPTATALAPVPAPAPYDFPVAVRPRLVSLTRSNALRRESRRVSSIYSAVSESQIEVNSAGERPNEAFDHQVDTAPNSTHAECLPNSQAQAAPHLSHPATAARVRQQPPARIEKSAALFNSPSFEIGVEPQLCLHSPLPRANIAEGVAGTHSVVVGLDGPSSANSRTESDETIRTLEDRVAQLERELRDKQSELTRKDLQVQEMLDELRLANLDAATWSEADPRHEAAMYGSQLRDTNAFLKSVGLALTPRGILMLKYLHKKEVVPQEPEHHPHRVLPVPATTIGSAPASLPIGGQNSRSKPSQAFNDLDKFMPLDQATKYAASLDSRSTLALRGALSVKVCRICRMPKFINAPLPQQAPPSPSSSSNNVSSSELNEFHSRTGATLCCAKNVCKECYIAGVAASIPKDWWHGIDTVTTDAATTAGANTRPGWLRCPITSCDHRLEVRSNLELMNLLRPLGDPDIVKHVSQFDRANILRDMLATIHRTRPVTSEALVRAQELHETLLRHGRMRDPFEQGRTGGDPAFHIDVKVLPVDSQDGSRTLQVPIFTGLLVVPQRIESSPSISSATLTPTSTTAADTPNDTAPVVAFTGGAGPSSAPSVFSFFWGAATAPTTTTAESSAAGAAAGAAAAVAAATPAASSTSSSNPTAAATASDNASTTTTTTTTATPAANFRRECSICCESVPDVTDGTAEDEASWAAAVAAFPGTWAITTRGFPSTTLLPACASVHALDICRTCLSRHLRTQLDEHGRNAAGRLTCPTPSCGHVYEHEEVRNLLLPTTTAATTTAATGAAEVEPEEENDAFARYDRLCLLQHLSSVEGFMWCLREGCHAGEIHHLPPARLRNLTVGSNAADATRNRVLCSTCRFEMCINHQTKWHQGRTCAQVDELMALASSSTSSSSSANNNLDELASRAWIAANTKKCPGPGCDYNVEKGEGCFHMTCRSCKFEFCWECLADWRLISKTGGPGGRRVYDREAHGEGCFFRMQGAPEATGVRGQAITEEMRRRAR